MTAELFIFITCCFGGFGAGLAAEGFGASFVSCIGIAIFAATFLFAHFRTPNSG